MTTSEKDMIRKAIKKKMRQTELAVAEYKELTKPVAPDVAIGRLSRMDAINNKSVAEAVLREAEAKLERLKRASIRLEEENYGLCIKCGKPIDIKRLMLMPDSMQCVRC